MYRNELTASRERLKNALERQRAACALVEEQLDGLGALIEQLHERDLGAP